MKAVIAYQITILTLLILSWVQKALGNYPDWTQIYEMPIDCIHIATLGGVMYCLRAVYLERCVRKRWDQDWELWYYLRPVTSAISGLVAYIFLNAGLIILEAEQASSSANYGFLAFAFIAGFNVANFSQKIEEVAKSTFGIEKSNASKSNE